MNKGNLFLDAKAGPFTLGTPPAPCRGRAGAEPWDQQEQRGQGQLVAWQWGGLGSHLGFAGEPWPLSSPLCVSVGPPERAGVVLGLLKNLETRALSQESEV